MLQGFWVLVQQLLGMGGSGASAGAQGPIVLDTLSISTIIADSFALSTVSLDSFVLNTVVTDTATIFLG